MAIVIEANYSKKLGLPAYSSHSYSSPFGSEVADLSQVERESAKLYAILQGSVWIVRFRKWDSHRKLTGRRYLVPPTVIRVNPTVTSGTVRTNSVT